MSLIISFILLPFSFEALSTPWNIETSEWKYSAGNVGRKEVLIVRIFIFTRMVNKNLQRKLIYFCILYDLDSIVDFLLMFR